MVVRAKARPGAINIGVGLAGTTQHLSAELFKFTMGLDLAIVNFRSSGDLLHAILRSDVDAGGWTCAAGVRETCTLKPAHCTKSLHDSPLRRGQIPIDR